MNFHVNGSAERVVCRVRVTVSGGGEEPEMTSSGDTVNEAVVGASAMLVERFLRRTGRGTSTLGFKDCGEREREGGGGGG